MPITPRTATVLCRVAAAIFALTAIFSLVAAYEAHQNGKGMRGYIAQSVIYTTLCVVFISIPRIRRRALRSDKDLSSKGPDDRNA